MAVNAITQQFKLVFFVPQTALSVCKAAVFKAGAGRYPGKGDYTECCFTVIGTAQFRPGNTANPNVGRVGELEEVEEVRVETICGSEQTARDAVQALKAAHPYETPAYEVYKLEQF